MDFITIIGYTSVIFHIWSFLSNNRKKILLIGSLSIFLYIVHIYFKDSSTATVLIASFGLSTSLLGLLLSSKNRKKLIKIIPVISVIIFILSGMEIMGFFAAVGTLFASYAKLIDDVLTIKITYLFSAISWLITGILLNSTPAILFDVAGIIALLISINLLKSKQKKLLFS